MSRIELRTLFAIAAAAFALRAGAAVLTEFKPVFPAYYYADAEFADREARETLAARARGERRDPGYTTSQRTHIVFTAALYRAFGAHPLAPKLVNALAASLGILAFALLSARVFDPPAAAAAGLLLASWPSHVFFTSQNFKEGLSCGAVMGALFLLAPDARRRPASAAGGLFALSVLGFLRAPAMLAAAGALAAAEAARRLPAGRRRAALGLGLPLCLAVAAFSFSPREVSEYRLSRQYSDRLYALGLSGREIGTQLFPDERMESRLDVLRFIPKASFHVLFMPLPGVYALEGKPGRVLAAAENLGLLAAFLLGLVSAARTGLEPARLALLLFLAAMTIGSSLAELDLGGASRHKLMYFPMIFPFAAEEAFRLMGRRRHA